MKNYLNNIYPIEKTFEDNSSTVKHPHKGIFWLIDERIRSFPFLETQSSFGVSKSGDSYVHKKVWQKIKPKSCNHPYNYYPRGRVEITPKGKYIVYMNPNIPTDYIPQIMKEFGLDFQPKVIYDNSNHYKSHFDKGWKPDYTQI